MNDRYTQIQEQSLQQKQSQIISHQQLLQASLVELPLMQLVDRVNTEMNDNPALELDSGYDDADNTEYSDFSDHSESSDTSEDYDVLTEREERQSALDDALSNIGRDDDELPVYHGGSAVAEDREEMVYGQTTSFYDQLKEQMVLLDMTDRQRGIMEYMIGSLDDDGLLRKRLDAISDELAIYRNIDASEEELREVQTLLQGFDPAGIGAASLQECLLLQIDRKDSSWLKDQMKRVVANYFEEFTQSLQQITPDFIVDTHDDGTVTFTLNNGELPELKVSQSFIDSMDEFQQNREHMSRQSKEALLYIKKKVDSAQGFIEALKVRRHTLTITMRAIIQLQHQFFVDGDEASLRPMILKDVAEKTGLDLSTVSRVSNSKYAQTRWGTFPLRHFFSDSYVTQNGEELSTRQIKVALREIVDAEDKKQPLSDDDIKAALAERGFPIARRTVAKYREKLGIPIARLRK